MSGDIRTGRRLLLDLRRGGSDRRMLRAVADLARLLGLSLHGLFIEDEALFAFASLPFAREIRLPTLEWMPLDAARLQEDLQQAARLMQSQLADIAGSAGIGHGFDILRGDLAAAVARLVAEGDVFAVIEATEGDLRPLALMTRTAAAVPARAPLLMLPPHFLPRRGPIVAIVANGTTEIIALGARLAAAAQEDLVILVAGSSPAISPEMTAVLAREAGLSPRAISVRTVPGGDPGHLVHALAGLHERLIVMEQPVQAEAAAGLATLCDAAILMLERSGRIDRS